MRENMQAVYENRRKSDDAFFFNSLLHIDPEFQISFDPTHEHMANLNLQRDQPTAKLAANLRRAFSGIVAGNVKATGIEYIKQHGPYQLNGDPEIMQALDQLLASFVSQNRMKISGNYVPCYDVIR